jgi:hypothetical protein
MGSISIAVGLSWLISSFWILLLGGAPAAQLAGDVDGGPVGDRLAERIEGVGKLRLEQRREHRDAFHGQGRSGDVHAGDPP